MCRNQNFEIFGWGSDRPSKYLGFSFFHNFFFALISFLSFSYLFAAVVDLGLPPTSEKASSRSMGNFYHGEAMCSHRKFCSEFFTQISEHFRAYLRLHWADHFDLGIIRKFFFSCKSWVWMMPILVKGDHVGSGKSQGVKKAKLFTRWLTWGGQSQSICLVHGISWNPWGQVKIQMWKSECSLHSTPCVIPFKVHIISGKIIISYKLLITVQ